MTRIAARDEPYPDIQRQMRHYKAKQILTLKALSRESFLSGSSFVVAWVTPSGSFQCYASEFLQPQLDNLFSSETRAELCAAVQAGKKATGAGAGAGERTASEEGMRGSVKTEECDEEGDDELDSQEEDGGDEETLGCEREGILTRLGRLSSIGEADVARGVNNWVASQQSSASFSNTSNYASTSSSISPPYLSNLNVTRTIDPAVTEFLLSKIASLDRSTTRTVVRTWMKAINSKVSYRSAKDKPAFWPKGVAWREPADLPEEGRAAVIFAILRNSSLPVHRLELATGEAGALITARQAQILRQIYRVARLEEAGLPIDLATQSATPVVARVALPVASIGPSGFGEGNLAFLFAGEDAVLEFAGSHKEKQPTKRTSGRTRSGFGVEVKPVASPRTRKRQASATAFEGEVTEKKTRAKASKSQKAIVVDQENVKPSPVVEHQQQRAPRQPLGQSNHLHQTFHREYQLKEEDLAPHTHHQQHQPTPFYDHPAKSSYRVDFPALSPHPTQYAPPPIIQHHYQEQLSSYSSAMENYALPPSRPLEQFEFYPVPSPLPSTDHLPSVPLQRTHSAPPISNGSNTSQYIPQAPMQPQQLRITHPSSSRLQQLGVHPPNILRSHSFNSASHSNNGSSNAFNPNTYYTPSLPATPSLGQGEFGGGSPFADQEYSGFDMPGRGFGLGIRMGGGEIALAQQSPMSMQELGFVDEYVQ